MSALPPATRGRAAWLPLVASLIVAGMMASPALAGVRTYWEPDSPEGGDWSDPANWSRGLPGLGDNAVVAAREPAQITSDGAVGLLDVDTWDEGGVFHTSGTLLVADTLSVGYAQGSFGLYELSRTGVLNVHNAWIGDLGVIDTVRSGRVTSCP